MFETEQSVLIIFILGEALKCNYCKSDVSFEDCDKYMKYAGCDEQFGLDRCMKIHTRASRSTEEKYERTCSSADECEKPSCKAAGDDKCDVYCCTGDNCNKTSVTGVSGHTLFVCAVLVFLIKLMD